MAAYVPHLGILEYLVSQSVPIHPGVPAPPPLTAHAEETEPLPEMKQCCGQPVLSFHDSLGFMGTT